MNLRSALLKVAMVTSLVTPMGCSSDTTEQPPAFDQQFIDMMTPHHQGAVMMAMLAETRAEHAEIKTMAMAIISAQNDEIGELKTWRKQWYGSDTTPDEQHMPVLPGMEDEPKMDMEKMMTELQTADPFDKSFIDDMIPHHLMAMKAANVALQKADHAEIKVMAADIIESQQKEIDSMTTWRTQWYPGG